MKALLDDSSFRPRAARVANVPFVRQTELHCGPAALAMTMKWAGRAPSLEQLSAKMFTPEKEGSLTTDFLAAARREGMLAVRLDGMRALFGAVASGAPVVVLQNLGLAWFPRWHYALVLAYDLDSRTVLLHSGEQAGLSIELDLFERTWRRADSWAVAILPPDRLPATAPPQEILAAIAALERVKRLEEARVAYSVFLSAWPDDPIAHFGLSNVLVEMRRFDEAVRSLEKAASLRPLSASIWHNLALAYERAGNRAHASRAARKALELVPDAERAAYRASLDALAQAKP